MTTREEKKREGSHPCLRFTTIDLVNKDSELKIQLTLPRPFLSFLSPFPRDQSLGRISSMSIPRPIHHHHHQHKPIHEPPQVPAKPAKGARTPVHPDWGSPIKMACMHEGMRIGHEDC